MCEWGNTELVMVKIPADLSCTGKEKYQYEEIDKCIAPIVRALSKADIDMRGSCCGHNKLPGEIHLQDGRCIVIFDELWWRSPIRACIKTIYIRMKFMIWKIFSRMHSILIRIRLVKGNKEKYGYF